MWRKDLDYTISQVDIDIKTDRCIGIEIRMKNHLPLYLFNVYLPSTNTCISYYQEVLDTLQVIYDTYCEQGIVMFAGDLNGQLGSLSNRRIIQTANIRGQCIEDFLSQNNLLSLVADVRCTGPIYTFWSDSNNGICSQLDHFLLSNEYRSIIEWCKVVDDNDMNTSDHVPIVCCVKWNIPRYHTKSRLIYNWSKVDTDMYKQTIRDNILQSMEPFIIDSKQDIDSMLTNVQSIIQNAMKKCIPISKSCPYKRPYWDPELAESHCNQKALRRVWINEGRPRGMHHNSYAMYKSAKRTFAKLLKEKQINYEQSKYHKAEQDIEMDSKNLWKYLIVRKLNSGCHSICHNGNVYSSPDELLNVWSKHFSDLLNENISENHDFDNVFKDTIDKQVTDMEQVFQRKYDNTGVLNTDLTVNEVAKICLSMPNHKAPGYDNISYESIKYGGHILYEYLTKLYNAMIKYAYIPVEMKLSIVIPLYKGKKKPQNDVNSYRGISLNQVLNKILEKIVLNRMTPWLRSNNIPPPQQQACSEGSSCVTLSYVVSEIINHYRNCHSKLHTCFVDIQQAFDTVWWSGLLYKIAHLGIRDKLWFLFKEWLYGSKCSVMLNGEFSSPFSISRSIKQGGMLSMLLFCIAHHDVHTEVAKRPAHRIIYNNVDVSSLSYADDTLLMSNTVNGLQYMLTNLFQYGRKWRVKFSPSKTVCLTFGGGGGDTGVPISHIPDFLPPNIPYPRFFTPQYPISQIFYPPISHIPDFTVN